MILLLLSAPAIAESTLTFAGAALLDLPAAEPLAPTGFGPGGALLIPVRWTPRPGASLRFGLEVGFATGQDRLIWTEAVDGVSYSFYSDDHTAMVGSARLLVGPEVAFLPRRALSPYLGAGAGGGLVMNWHVLGDSEAALEVDQARTSQWVAAAGGHLGLRVGAGGPVALEVEVGYTASFLPQAPLSGVSADLEAVRAPYALDVLRGGLGVTIPL